VQEVSLDYLDTEDLRENGVKKDVLEKMV